jgi:hypothetical protein
MSPELKALVEHFKRECNVKLLFCGTLEQKQYPHWKRLVLTPGLDCEELQELSNYIKKTFSNKGRYTHKLPRVGIYNNELCLTVDIELIREKIMVQSVVDKF